MQGSRISRGLQCTMMPGFNMFEPFLKVRVERNASINYIYRYQFMWTVVNCWFRKDPDGCGVPILLNICCSKGHFEFSLPLNSWWHDPVIKHGNWTPTIYIILWLVVWNSFYFSHHIIPTDFNSIIFQRCRFKAPTSTGFSQREKPPELGYAIPWNPMISHFKIFQ